MPIENFIEIVNGDLRLAKRNLKIGDTIFFNPLQLFISRISATEYKYIQLDANNHRPAVDLAFQDAGNSLPLTTSTQIDGVTVTTDMRVVVLDSATAGEDGKIYSASVVGTDITWNIEQDGTGSDDPANGATVWVRQGAEHGSEQWTYNGSEWIQTGGGLFVNGPASSTDNTIPTFDGTTGDEIQGSLVTIDDNGTINIPAGQEYHIDGTSVLADVVHNSDDTYSDNAITRFDGTTGDNVQSSLIIIDDNGTINIPSGEEYQVDGTSILTNVVHNIDPTYVDNTIATYDGTTGDNIQATTVTIDDNGTVNIPSGQSYQVDGTSIFDLLPLATETVKGIREISTQAEADARVSTDTFLVPSVMGDYAFNIDGTSQDNVIVTFDGTGGGNIQNTNVTIDDNGTINIPASQEYQIDGTSVLNDVVHNIDPTYIDNAVATYDGTTGDNIQATVITIDDNGTVNIPAGQEYQVDGTSILSLVTPNVFEEVASVVRQSNSPAYDEDFVFGSPQLDDDGTAAHDARFLFDKSQSAFRAGIAYTTEWDSANRGFGSVALGEDNLASGDYSAINGGYGHVASALCSTVGGGRQNTASDLYTTVCGGYQGTASVDYATVCGGDTNQATAFHATVCGGDINIASLNQAFIGGGRNNAASGISSVISGGDSNQASATNATVGGGTTNIASGTGTVVSGGSTNTASSDYATVTGGFGNTTNGSYAQAGGFYSSAYLYGQNAFATGRFAANGDSQKSTLYLRADTTTDTPEVMYINNSASNKLVLPASRTWNFEGKITASTLNSTAAACFTIKGCIRRDNANNTVMTAFNSVTTDLDEIGVGGITMTADDTNEALNINITGKAVTNIRWSGYITISELGY